MSAIEKLEQRLTALEEEVAKLRNGGGTQTDNRPWFEKIYGSFEGNPHFKEAMELGRKYRESLRPKPRKKKRKRGKDGGS